MKKVFTSLVFMLTFAGYGLYRYFGNSSALEYAAPVANPSQTPVADIAAQQDATPTPTRTPPAQQPTPPQPTQPVQPIPASVPVVAPAPAAAPATKPKGQYTDGTYTGSAADAYYGTVQVQATVSGGKLADVTFLQYPNDRGTSRTINARAMPLLKTEAIQVQNAQVNTVSGASETSKAFRESLAAALAQAKS